jgi:hypothetical protein
MPSLSLRFKGDYASVHGALVFYLRCVDITRDPFNGSWYLSGASEPIVVKKTFETLLASRLGPRQDPLTQPEEILKRVVSEKISEVRLDHSTSSSLPVKMIEDVRRNQPRLSVMVVWHGVMDMYGRFGWDEDGEWVDETFKREVDVLDIYSLPVLDETASGTFRENAPVGDFLTFINNYNLSY